MNFLGLNGFAFRLCSDTIFEGQVRGAVGCVVAIDQVCCLRYHARLLHSPRQFLKLLVLHLHRILFHMRVVLVLVVQWRILGRHLEGRTMHIREGRWRQVLLYLI